MQERLAAYFRKWENLAAYRSAKKGTENDGKEKKPVTGRL